MTQNRARTGNPDWTRDELILALDVYVRLAGTVPGPRLAAVVDLSTLLRRAALHPSIARNSTFRSPASVVMKLMNFRSIDPNYGGKGLTAGGRLDREVWREFSGNRPRLAKVAAVIREVLSAGSDDFAAAGTDDVLTSEAEEGAVLTRLHRTRERNGRLVEAKKRTVLREAGRLSCEACGFSFAVAYGDIGMAFIECHHRRPLSDLGERQRTSLDDLALLCANCHRMIHVGRPWLTVEELRGVVLARIESRRSE